jgi:hypothetical protein
MQATATTKSVVKNHIDGGTYRELAFAETRDRWGVAVTEWTTYRGMVVFQIHRVSDNGQMLSQGTYKDRSRGARRRKPALLPRQVVTREAGGLRSFRLARRRGEPCLPRSRCRPPAAHLAGRVGWLTEHDPRLLSVSCENCHTSRPHSNPCTTQTRGPQVLASPPDRNIMTR